jgi:hypothetical protein
VVSWISFKSGLEGFVKGMDREYRAKMQLELQEEEKTATKARRKMVHHALQGEYGLVAIYEVAWRAARRTAEEISGRRSRTRDVVDAALQLVFGSQGINLCMKQTRPPTRITHLHDYDALPGLPASAAADLSTSAGMGRGYATMVSHFSADSPTGLFRDRPGHQAAQEILLGTLPQLLPPPVPGTATVGGDLLTLADLTRALKTTAHTRSPGIDGIPFEFYKALWTEVGPHLCDVLNSAFLNTASDEPLSDLLEGIIALIAKPGKPRDRITSYRGLTLLGCDVKLASLAISDRMQVPLDTLIDQMQGAFIRGRDIADNVLYRLGLLEHLRSTGHPAWLILTDLATAYDSVRREYLYMCLQAMGLAKQGCLRWTTLLLSGTTSSMLVNGRVLPPFPTKGGLPQGLPLSATLFVVILHPWHTWLRSQASCGRYLRPLLPDGSAAPVVGLFADDSEHIELEEHMEQNGPVLEEGYLMLEGASGVGLGVAKCVAVSVSGRIGPLPRTLRVGSMQFRVAQVGEEVRQLGVIVSCDHGEVQRRTFGQQPGALIGKAATWKGLHPRIPERVYIALTYLISKMVYQCRFHAPSSCQALAIQQVIRGFVRESDHPEEEPVPGSGLHPSQWVWALPKIEGGWGLPDVGTFAAAMATRTVARLFAPGKHPWKVVTMHQYASAQPDLANSAAWLVTAPHLLRTGNNRLQAMASALAELGLYRIIPPEAQGFYSVMAEPILANLRITRGRSTPTPLRGSDLTSAEGKGWSHLREVRRAYQGIGGGGAEGVEGVARDVNLILDLLPVAWREKVTLAGPDPVSEWAAIGDGSQVIYEGEDGTALFDVQRNGSLVRCGGVIGDAEPRRAAAVHFRQKPGPLPSGTAAWERETGGIWLLGEWHDLVLDPTVWGIDGDTPFHLLTVRESRVRLCQKRAVAELPSYKLGSGILPPTWEEHALPLPVLPGPITGMLTHTALTGGTEGGSLLQQPLAGGGGGRQLPPHLMVRGRQTPQLSARGGDGRGRREHSQQQQVEVRGGTEGLQPGTAGGGHGRPSHPLPEQPAAGNGRGRTQLQQPPGGRGGRGQRRQAAAGGERERTPSPQPEDTAGHGQRAVREEGEANGGDTGTPQRIQADRGLAGMELRWTAPRLARAGGAASSSRFVQRDFEEALRASLPPWLGAAIGGSAERDQRARRRGRLRGEEGGEGQEEGGDSDNEEHPLPPSSSGHHSDLSDFLHPPGRALHGGRGVAGVWHRLHHSGGSQAEISLGWRLLHAALPVRAKVAYHLLKPLEEGECEARDCNQQETLSHAFMECQRVRGAVTWLLDLQEAISGRRPPWDARVILADDQRIWKPGATMEDQLLWQRLRLVTLYHIWKARSSRQRFEDNGGDLTAAVTGSAAADIVASIRRDWARTKISTAIEEAGGAHLFSTRRNLSITEEVFKAVWTQGGVLCAVTGPGTMKINDPSAWVD